MNTSDLIISSLSLAKRMKYKPKTALPEAVKSMFTYQETNNTTTRVRIDTGNIMEDSERCDEVIYHDFGIEKSVKRRSWRQKKKLMIKNKYY